MPPLACEVPARGTRVPGGGAGPEGRAVRAGPDARVSALPRSSGRGRVGYACGVCGRSLPLTSGKDVAEAFDLAGLPELTPRYNIAPTKAVAAVRADRARQDYAEGSCLAIQHRSPTTSGAGAAARRPARAEWRGPSPYRPAVSGQSGVAPAAGSAASCCRHRPTPATPCALLAPSTGLPCAPPEPVEGPRERVPVVQPPHPLVERRVDRPPALPGRPRDGPRPLGRPAPGAGEVVVGPAQDGADGQPRRLRRVARPPPLGQQPGRRRPRRQAAQALAQAGVDRLPDSCPGPSDGPQALGQPGPVRRPCASAQGRARGAVSGRPGLSGARGHWPGPFTWPWACPRGGGTAPRWGPAAPRRAGRC
jgi:hypothetical protein